MAENMLTKMPIAKVKAKPLMMLVPSQNKIRQVIKEEIFESRIEVQARLNPSSIAPPKLLPQFSSSLIRAKIKILASTAMPMDKMKPAMPAKVKVTENNLKIAKNLNQIRNSFLKNIV